MIISQVNALHFHELQVLAKWFLTNLRIILFVSLQESLSLTVLLKLTYRRIWHIKQRYNRLSRISHSSFIT